MKTLFVREPNGIHRRLTTIKRGGTADPRRLLSKEKICAPQHRGGTFTAPRVLEVRIQSPPAGSLRTIGSVRGFQLSPADTPTMPGMLRKSTAFVPRYQKFESIFLQRGVSDEPVIDGYNDRCAGFLRRDAGESRVFTMGASVKSRCQSTARLSASSMLTFTRPLGGTRPLGAISSTT